MGQRKASIWRCYTFQSKDLEIVNKVMKGWIDSALLQIWRECAMNEAIFR